MRSGDSSAPRNNQSSAVILDIISRLWQTKLKSITVLEKWMVKTTDFEIRTGIKAQLADERRHLRLIGDELKYLGGNLDAGLNDPQLNRPFAIVQAQPNDLYRMFAFYRGIKAFTLLRCDRLIPVVDSRLGRLLSQIAMEEQRHIRWAEMRISRGVDITDVRQGNMLVERVKASLDSIWSKPWQLLTNPGTWNRPGYAG